MASPTEEFFAALEKRGHEPLLEKASGTVRIDLVTGEQTDHWLVSINKGDIAVSRESSEADCVIRSETEMFDRIASGEANAYATVLRGAAQVEGNAELLRVVPTALPRPPGQRDQPTSAGLCAAAVMSDPLVKILNGNLFVVSDTRGDFEASPTDPTGLFALDTRFLSSGC